MFKIHWNKKNTTEAIYACTVLAIALTGISLVVHIGVVYAAIRGFFRVISPIVYGLSLAYIINPLLKLIERRVISPIKTKKVRLSPMLRRILSLVVSYLIVALILFLIGLLIFPQIVKNYRVIVDSTSDFIQSSIRRISDSFGMDPERMIEQVGEYSASFLSFLGRIGGQFALWLLLFLVGCIISFFVLLHKEHLQASVKKLLAALLKPKRFNSTMRVARLADNTFGRFFIGKIFDSLIIGVISFVVFWIFRMPYYPLLAAVICITNIIPYFGPIIGAIPCVILVLTESPMKAVWIAVMILIIQQVDGNIIGPKIVGNAIGIKSLWVVISITIMGSFFGFVGMLIGAPL
ncbi:MAG: AI-2E family transporter, partial [Clostridia bacterium]|nr:AI-2E family transporter [Clostridia bacterium]